MSAMPGESGPAVQAINVVKEYWFGGRTLRALNGVTFSVERGLIAAIVGPSGSGKTTLLNLLGALDVPTTGEVIIAGTRLNDLDERGLTAYRRTHVGFVFQRFNLIANLTALENVMLPMEFARVPRRDRVARARELLATVGVEQRAVQRPPVLSGGEQQRIAIARALANDPAIILADEPTGNLDADSGAAVVTLLKQLAQSEHKAVIVVTHNPAVAGAADLILPIRDGRIMADERASLQRAN